MNKDDILIQSTVTPRRKDGIIHRTIFIDNQRTHILQCRTKLSTIAEYITEIDSAQYEDLFNICKALITPYNTNIERIIDGNISEVCRILFFDNAHGTQEIYKTDTKLIINKITEFIKNG